MPQPIWAISGTPDPSVCRRQTVTGNTQHSFSPRSPTALLLPPAPTRATHCAATAIAENVGDRTGAVPRNIIPNLGPTGIRRNLNPQKRQRHFQRRMAQLLKYLLQKMLRNIANCNTPSKFPTKVYKLDARHQTPKIFSFTIGQLTQETTSWQTLLT